MKENFDAEKAVQVAALLIELNGGSINRYWLIKMMYEADRIACERWGHPMTGDAPVSMEHGPVLGRILDLTKGTSGPDASRWNEIIGEADDDHMLSLKSAIPDKDRLSKKDVKIIAEIHQRLGRMSFQELKAWSHALPEYVDVGKGGKLPIQPEDRLKAVKKTSAQIEAIAQEIAEDQIIKVLCGTE